VSVLIQDLVYRAREIRFESYDWAVIVRMLSAMNVVDAETLRQWDGAAPAYVPRDVARRIGRHLERKFAEDILEDCTPLEIPDYIRPIATSNGLWIDPALPLLRRPGKDYIYLGFAHFCHTCEGFSIG